MVMMNGPRWLTYLRTYVWTCPACGQKNTGLREYETGRIDGECRACGDRPLLFLWCGNDWAYAPTAGVVKETD